MMQAGTVIQHPRFGPAMPELNWVPAPRYILRRDRVLRHLKKVAPGKILDIGCGPGALVSELAALGFDAYGVDRSDKALRIGRHLQSRSPGMTLQAELDEAWKGSFDLILSFEVIEHLEDDVGAMREWRDYLKRGGKMILSTPAHPSRWNAADEWAGHVRRYERKQLVEAVKSAGFEVERIECYGFPLANVMEVLSAPAYRNKLNKMAGTAKDADALTNDSGSDRATHTRFWPLYSSALAALPLRAFCQLQRPFLNTGLGNGFIVIAKNPD